MTEREDSSSTSTPTKLNKFIVVFSSESTDANLYNVPTCLSDVIDEKYVMALKKPSRSPAVSSTPKDGQFVNGNSTKQTFLQSALQASFPIMMFAPFFVPHLDAVVDNEIKSLTNRGNTPSSEFDCMIQLVANKADYHRPGTIKVDSSNGVANAVQKSPEVRSNCRTHHHVMAVTSMPLDGTDKNGLLDGREPPVSFSIASRQKSSPKGPEASVPSDPKRPLDANFRWQEHGDRTGATTRESTRRDPPLNDEGVSSSLESDSVAIGTIGSGNHGRLFRRWSRLGFSLGPPSGSHQSLGEGLQMVAG